MAKKSVKRRFALSNCVILHDIGSMISHGPELLDTVDMILSYWHDTGAGLSEN